MPALESRYLVGQRLLLFQVGIQESQDLAVRFLLVLFLDEAVALILEKDVLYRNAFFLDGGDHPIAFHLRYARVLGPWSTMTGLSVLAWCGLS